MNMIFEGHTYKFIRLVEKHPDINNIIVQFRINHPSKKTGWLSTNAIKLRQQLDTKKDFFFDFEKGVFFLEIM